MLECLSFPDVSDDNTAPRYQPIKDVHKALGLWSIRKALTFAFSGAVLLLIAAWFGLSWLLGSPPHAKPKPLDTTAQLELLKLVFALVAGVGALVALVTAYRRQRIDEAAGERAERIQAHAEQVAQAAAHDATERRVTELYGQAVEQLGHDKAAVRLGGLYSLERLAQDHPTHRQTVTDVICAYLRMPYHLPSNTEPGTPPVETDTAARQELQVRLAAQRFLERHLAINSNDLSDAYWSNLTIDLTEAHLINFNLSYCNIHHIELTKSRFTGGARFDRARFSGGAWFEGAQFNGGADFDRAQFDEDARFEESQFSGDTQFQGVSFSENVHFDGARFSGDAEFNGAEFGGNTWFKKAQFSKDASFNGAQFGGNAEFNGAQFNGDARFNQTQFSEDAWFSRVQFNGDALFEVAQFDGETWFDKSQFHGITIFYEAKFHHHPDFDEAVANPDAESDWPEGWELDETIADHEPVALLVRQK